MKILLFALVIVLAGSSLIDEKGPHGGRIQKVDNYTIEVKRDYAHFYAWLLDAENKTLTSREMGCEIRFYVLDGSAVDMPLMPQADGGFTLDYEAAKYNSFRVTFKLADKDISAKFESENALVKEAVPVDPGMRQVAPR